MNDHSRKIGVKPLYINREDLERDIIGFSHQEIRRKIHKRGYSFDYTCYSLEDIQKKTKGLYPREIKSVL